MALREIKFAKPATFLGRKSHWRKNFLQNYMLSFIAFSFRHKVTGAYFR